MVGINCLNLLNAWLPVSSSHQNVGLDQPNWGVRFTVLPRLLSFNVSPKVFHRTEKVSNAYLVIIFSDILSWLHYCPLLFLFFFFNAIWRHLLRKETKVKIRWLFRQSFLSGTGRTFAVQYCTIATWEKQS